VTSVDPDLIAERLSALTIETPSWGYGDSGTRFATFQQAGRPRDVFERVDDAAEVHRLTGTAGAVALHFPWDQVDDYAAHLKECVEIATALGSTAQSLWFADGTNYAGQDDLRARRRRLTAALQEVYAVLPEEQELLVEYKFFEPAFYATDFADWGSSLLICQKLGERAKVLVDLGHHAQGTNVEHITAILADEGRLGGFHFNNRKYADDDLIVGSVNPFELFLIFCELAAGEGPLPRLTIDQAHNVEAKVEAMVLSVVNLQESYVKSLIVDREALAEAQQEGDVLRGHEILLDAYKTDVRPLVARWREQAGAVADPVAALREGGYVQKITDERGAAAGVAGGWGR
jgi:L-rhamnose isomerase/sugar isomerase